MQKSTVRLESEKLSTFHHVVPSLVGLEHHLFSNPKPPLVAFPQPFKDQCLNLLSKRFGYVAEDAHLLAAAALSFHGLK